MENQIQGGDFLLTLNLILNNFFLFVFIVMEFFLSIAYRVGVSGKTLRRLHVRFESW